MRTLICLLAIIWFAVPCPTHADTPVQVQAIIQAICKRRIQAYYHNNLNGMLEGYASGFVLKNIFGRQTTMAQLKAYNAAGMARHGPHYAMLSVIRQVSLSGNTARVLVETQETYSFPRSTAHGTYHYNDRVVRQTEWIKGKQSWQETSSQDIHDVKTYSR